MKIQRERAADRESVAAARRDLIGHAVAGRAGAAAFERS